jgi:hypothetical protein
MYVICVNEFSGQRVERPLKIISGTQAGIPLAQHLIHPFCNELVLLLEPLHHCGTGMFDSYLLALA